MSATYTVKCDDCKTEIGTGTMRESAAGGRCDSCRNLIDLRASAAMRAEDLRIATKHREIAGGRVMSTGNHAAYLSALKWEDSCREAARVARVAVIASQS